MTIPYLSQIKIAVGVALFVGYTWAVSSISIDVERAGWLQKEVARTETILTDKVESEKISVDAGKRYEKEKKKIQHVYNTPSEALNARMQGADGDILFPGELGMRLNDIATANASASKPD